MTRRLTDIVPTLVVLCVLALSPRRETLGSAFRPTRPVRLNGRVYHVEALKFDASSLYRMATVGYP